MQSYFLELVQSCNPHNKCISNKCITNSLLNLINVIIVNNNDFRKYQFIQLHGHGDAINYFLV